MYPWIQSPLIFTQRLYSSEKQNEREREKREYESKRELKRG